MDQQQLASECKEVFKSMKIDQVEADFSCQCTSLQAESHDHGIGRLTASKFGRICKTNIDMPAKSLIDSILKKQNVNCAALDWGRKKEGCAREDYVKAAEKNHQAISFKSTGFHVNPMV